MTNFPVGIQNQPTVNVVTKERVVMDVINSLTGYITIDTNGYSLATFQFSNNTTAVSIIVQASTDNKLWSNVQLSSLSSKPSNLAGGSGMFFKSIYTNTFQLQKAGRFIRISQTTYSDSLTAVSILLSNSPVSEIGKNLTIPNDSSWRFVCPVGGLTNNTSHILTTGSNQGNVNLLLWASMHNNGTVDSEIQIRSGASGSVDSVLFRTILKAGQNIIITPLPALKSGSGATLEVFTTTGTIYFNASGILSNSY